MKPLPHETELEETLKAIEHLKKQNRDRPLFDNEIKRLERKLHQLKEEIYSNLTPWERITISRHPARPHTSDYIAHLTSKFTELSGDRHFANDNAIIGGLAQIDDEMKCVIIGQEKGKTTESRLHHNFGMTNPEGYRKSLRLMQLAERFHLPIVTLIDTSGANTTLGAEERGQGWAIAENLRAMSRLKTPIIVVIIGEGCSGGAIGIGIGDVIGILEHAYYSVISPEGCASILWKDKSRKEEAAASLCLNAEYLLKNGIVDAIIEEPLGGAHHNPQMAFEAVKTFIVEQWKMLKMIPPDILIEQRYNKFRRMGCWKTKEDAN